MSNYVAAIWKCRYFWLSLVRMDLRTRYRRSALGLGWSLLHPICMTIVLCTMFHSFFAMNIREYGVSLLAGMCFWSFVTAVTLGGSQCLFQGEAYIRQFPAPLAIYPLRTMLASCVHFVIALSVTVIATWILRGFDNVFALIWLVPALLLMMIFGWALAVLSGFATTYFPDMQHLSEVGLQMLFYATPIIYPVEALRNRGIGWIADLNPLTALVELFRVPLLQGTMPSIGTYLTASGAVLAVSLAAILTLSRLQQRIIFQL